MLPLLCIWLTELWCQWELFVKCTYDIRFLGQHDNDWDLDHASLALRLDSKKRRVGSGTMEEHRFRKVQAIEALGDSLWCVTNLLSLFEGELWDLDLGEFSTGKEIVRPDQQEELNQIMSLQVFHRTKRVGSFTMVPILWEELLIDQQAIELKLLWITNPPLISSKLQQKHHNQNINESRFLYHNRTSKIDQTHSAF